MRKFILSLAALLIGATSVSAQGLQPIPTDKDLRVGKLENGMTYYIRHNEKPKGQASFYILHDVGAIQENDDQQGLAHFLEHMAFNGTKNLPGKTMINYLEKIGVMFGYNLNAGTSWDYTEYMVKDVPVAREGAVDTALTILHDWSHFIALEPSEIDSERGVIMEELRTRDGAQWRSTIAMLKALYKDTKYAERNLIGYLDGLKSFDHKALEEFYHTWYRPDYQSIYVIGDIDVDAVEAKIKTLMSDIPAADPDAPAKEVIMVPGNEEPIISIFSDPEMQNSSVRMFAKRDALPREINNTLQRSAINTVIAMAESMENARLQEMRMKPDAPFLSAYMGEGQVFVNPTLEATTFVAQTEDGKLLDGFRAIYTEMERMRRHGFTQAEFERAQTDLLRSAERQYANRNDVENDTYAERYIDAHRNNYAMPDAETEWQIDSMLISSLSVADVNSAYSSLTAPDKNLVIVLNSIAKEGVEIPTEEQIKAVIAEVSASEIEPYADDTVKEPLIPESVRLKGSKVKKTAYNESLGTTEWTLKNGITVVVKPTMLKADEVRLDVTAKGGLSTLTDEEYYTGDFLPIVAAMSGVGKFSANDLKKQLSGITASAGLSIDSYEHGIGAASSPKDIETMLQLVYLNFTSPRFDENDLNTMKKMYSSYFANIESNPDYIAQREYMKTLYGDNPRRQLTSRAQIEALQLDDMPAVYHKLYDNAKNFRFTFVGNVDLDELRPLVEKYIGSLPVKGAELDVVDDGVRAVKGVVTNDFKQEMQQPKVSVMLSYTGQIDYTPENRMAMTLLSQALDSRYLQSIREEKGGTYGVQVNASVEKDPIEAYDMLIKFDTNAKQADELIEIAIAELEKIAQEGPRADDIAKTKEFLVKNYNNTLEKNGGWINAIERWYDEGYDYKAEYLTTVEKVGAEQVKALAAKILADNNKNLVIMRPAQN